MAGKSHFSEAEPFPVSVKLFSSKPWGLFWKTLKLTVKYFAFQYFFLCCHCYHLHPFSEGSGDSSTSQHGSFHTCRVLGVTFYHSHLPSSATRCSIHGLLWLLVPSGLTYSLHLQINDLFFTFSIYLNVFNNTNEIKLMCCIFFPLLLPWMQTIWC